MTSDISERLEEMLKEPFTVKDTFTAVCWQRFCRASLVFRYIYMKTPFLVKIIAGLPLLYFGKNVLIAYLIFVVLSVCLDASYHYDFSEVKFSFKKYFKTYMIKNILFLSVAFFMYEYYFHKFGWVCFIYSIPMLLISVAYVLPIFDKRIYK